MSLLFLAVAAALCLATLALMLMPLLRRSPPAAPTRAEFDLSLYRDQLAEVDKEASRGLLGAAEAQAARIEVKRRLLAAADAARGGTASVAAGAGGRRWAIPAFLALLVPGATAALYFFLGQPEMPDQPLAERQAREMLAAGASPEEMVSLADAVAKLEQRLQARPNDAEGWFLLGRSYLTMRRYSEALRALTEARRLAPAQPQVVDAYAEGALAAAGGRVDEKTSEALSTLLTLDPGNPKARFLLGLKRAQQGDPAGAAQDWADLLASAPADAPWLPTVREHLNRAAAQAGLDPATVQPLAETQAPAAAIPGPSEADIAASARMSAEDRQRMIDAMVERLASRLAENPDDVEGWRNLARAWDILGEPEKAAEARARVAALERR